MGDTGNLFLMFLASRRTDLQRIARKTRGEYSVDDLCGVGWEAVAKISKKRNGHVDLSNPEEQDLVLGWIYNVVVRRGEKNVRYAVRLDKDWDSDDAVSSETRLAILLESNGSFDQAGLMDSEERQEELLEIVGHSYSQFSAYMILLDRFKWDMLAVAEHLKLLATTVARRMQAYREHTRYQPSLFDRIQTIERDFIATVARRVIRVSVPECGAQQLAWEFA